MKILELTYEGVWRVSASEAITIDVDGVTVEAALFEPATARDYDFQYHQINKISARLGIFHSVTLLLRTYSNIASVATMTVS